MPRKLFEKEKNPKNPKRKRSDSDSYYTERLRFGFLGFKVSVQKGNWNKLFNFVE